MLEILERNGDNGMSQEAKQLELTIIKAEIEKDRIKAEISDGRIISIPLHWFPKLALATSNELANFQISPSGYGLHWEDLDEDISIKAFISYSL